MLKRLKRSRLFAFNQIDRDEWVAAQAGRIPPNSRVLDVGAGTCPYRHLFAHCSYQSQDAEILDSNQLLNRSGYGEIDFHCDVSDIPVPDSSYDAVLCTEVLEHVPEPSQLIFEIARILKPGGTLILTAPLGSCLHQEPYHFYGGYTPWWYQRVLPMAGFTGIQITANGSFYKFFSQESIRFVRMSSPASNGWPLLHRLLWSPLWLVLLPLMAGLIPIVCHMVDRYDRTGAFTVGYHVIARRTG